MSKIIRLRHEEERIKREQRPEDRYRSLYLYIQLLEKLEEKSFFSFESSKDSDHGDNNSESEDGTFEKESTSAMSTRNDYDRRLIDAYLNTTPRSLHSRRTLDQSYYYMLEKRDNDRVVFRWAKEMGKNKEGSWNKMKKRNEKSQRFLIAPSFL